MIVEGNKQWWLPIPDMVGIGDNSWLSFSLCTLVMYVTTIVRYRPDASLHSRVLAMRGKAWEPATTRASLASAGYITRELLQ